MAAADLVWIGDDSGNEGDVNTAANWESRTAGETARVPTAGDSIFFTSDAANDCNDGLATLAAVALAGVTIEQSFSYNIGVGESYLQVLCSGDVNIGTAAGFSTSQTSRIIMLDVGTTATDIIVHSTGTSSVSDMPALRLKANNASTTLTVKKGTVGVAIMPGETTTIGSLSVTYDTNQTGDATVTLGEDVTVTTIDKIGGKLVANCAATTITQAAGTITTQGTGAVTTVNVKGGTAYLESSGTITNLNCYAGTTDMSKSRTARTVTNVTVYAGAKYIRDNAIVTETNGIDTESGIITITGA